MTMADVQQLLHEFIEEDRTGSPASPEVEGPRNGERVEVRD